MSFIIDKKKSSFIYLMIISLAFIVSGLCSTAVAYTWYTYNGHWYALTENYGPWTSAEAEAQLVCGHLVTINDESENTWLTTTFAGTYAEGHDGDADFEAANIGYYATDGDGSGNNWGWISGESVSYENRVSNWDSYYAPHAYIHLGSHPAAGTWNHASWHTEPGASKGYFKGIIECDTQPVPVPGTFFLFGTGLFSFACVRKRKRFKL